MKRLFLILITITLIIPVAIFAADESEIMDYYVDQSKDIGVHDWDRSVSFTPSDNYQITRWDALVWRSDGSGDYDFAGYISKTEDDEPDTANIEFSGTWNFDELPASEPAEWVSFSADSNAEILWVTTDDRLACWLHFTAGANPGRIISWKADDDVTSYYCKSSDDNWASSSNLSDTLSFRIYGSTTPHYYENGQWNASQWSDALSCWVYVVESDNETITYGWDDENYEWDYLMAGSGLGDDWGGLITNINATINMIDISESGYWFMSLCLLAVVYYATRRNKVVQTGACAITLGAELALGWIDGWIFIVGGVIIAVYIYSKLHHPSSNKV